MAKIKRSIINYKLLIYLCVVTWVCDVKAIPCTFRESNDGDSGAECNNRRLTRFPGKWPDGLRRLNMSSNFLTSLDGLADPKLTRLHHLDVSHNSLTWLPGGAIRYAPFLQHLDLGYSSLVNLTGDVFSGLNNLTSLNLTHTGLRKLSDAMFSHITKLTSLCVSYNKLGSVPTAALRHVPRLQRLDLSGNNLRTVTSRSLAVLHDLQYLNLQDNQLSDLHPAAFSGLGKLTTLDLNCNHLDLNNRSYPPGVFSSVSALTTLYLNGNLCDIDSVEGDYPPNVFNSLWSLQTLSIDTFRKPHFEAVFTSLNNLTSLILAASCKHRGCHMKQISNSTFAASHHSGLGTLVIDGFPLFKVEVCAFCQLPHLSSLKVKASHLLDLSDLLLALYGLQNQTLNLVDFSDNHRHNLPTILDETNMLYLKNACIRKLDLSDCGIAGLSSTVFRRQEKLLKCLKHIDISKNQIKSVELSMILKLQKGLTNVETIITQDQHTFAFHHSNKLIDSVRQSDLVFYVNTPSSLRSVNASAAIQDLSFLPRHIHFLPGGNLTDLDLSYCGASACPSTITGLTNIRMLDFSGNDCFVLGDHIFRNMTSLRRLRIASLNLQEKFLFSNGTELLRTLTELEELDMSHNDLQQLPTDLLRQQAHLQRLVLAGNRFQAIPVDLSKHTLLTELDLSDNMIPTLPLHHRQTLDSLSVNHRLTLSLRGNPLTCTCQALDMVKWLAVTNVRLDGNNRNDGYDEDYDDNGRDYPCVLEDGGMSSTALVAEQWESHWRRCVGLPFFTVSITALLLQLLLLLLTYLLWRSWSYVRHAWFVLRHLRLPRRMDFAQDAVLVHADSDLELALRVKRCLKRAGPRLRLAISEELIVPGSFYAEGIATCIERSWKVMLLVTQTFLQDDWSGFAVLQAQGSMSDAMPDRVLVLLLDNLHPGDARCPTHVSMDKLLRMVPESSVYHMPQDVTMRHPLWGMLAQTIAKE